MSEKMTLEQVRDGLLQLVKQCARTSVYEPIQEANCAKMATTLESWLAAINSHLAASKAQTADVEAIRRVIGELHRETGYLAEMGEQLVAALPK